MKINKSKKQIIIIAIMFFGIFSLAQNSQAAVIWGDHFDSDSDFVCTTGDVAGLTGIEGEKHYEDCSCSHTANTEIRIESSLAHGGSGKGLRYRFDNSGDSTQTCQLRIHDTGAYAHLFQGYWLKIPDQPIGGADASLKMGRFYSGNSIIPGMNLATGEFYLFWQAANRIGWNSSPKVNLYTVPDTGWHYYIQEFETGEASDGDVDYFDGTGTYRLWVDNTLQFEMTDIDWGDVSGSPFSWAGGYLSENIENLNGDYNAGLHDVYYDDTVWTTTKADADDFLGIGDATPPAAPSGLNVW